MPFVQFSVYLCVEDEDLKMLDRIVNDSTKLLNSKPED